MAHFIELEKGMLIPDYTIKPNNEVDVMFDRAMAYFNEGAGSWCTHLWQAIAQCRLGDCLNCVMNGCIGDSASAIEKQTAFARIAGNRGYVITRKGYQQYTSLNLSKKHIQRMEV